MKNKKKIAIFIDWFFPGYKAGGPITSVMNLVDSLNKYFEFYIITSDRDLGDSEAYGDLQINVWLTKKSYKIIYLSPKKQTFKFYLNLFKDVKFDKIYFNSLFSLKFTIVPLFLARKKYSLSQIILAPRGMSSNQAFARKSIKKKIFLFFSGIINLFNGITFHATNEAEKNDIVAIFKKNKVKVVSNLPKIPSSVLNKNIEKFENELKLVSIARISQEKNTLFALKTLKNIKSAKIIFDLYGMINDNQYWEQCKKFISILPENIIVNYKGSIDSNLVTETFEKYHFALMPSIGENFGHSIFEAMSSGTPVIISDNTPWKNLEQKKIGWDIDLNDKQKFEDTIIFCSKMKQVEYQKMSENVHKFALNYILNSSLIEKMLKLFDYEN